MGAPRYAVVVAMRGVSTTGPMHTSGRRQGSHMHRSALQPPVIRPGCVHSSRQL